MHYFLQCHLFMYTNWPENYHHYSLREINLLAPDCTASEWKNHDSKAGYLILQATIYICEPTAHSL